MTDLPMDGDGFDLIMVVVDHGLSKGIVLTPCSKFGLTAEKTAQLYIDNVYSRFGLAEKMISDKEDRNSIPHSLKNYVPD